MDRKTHWDMVYSKNKYHTVSWYQVKPEISLDLISRCNLSVSAPIIDIGGGISSLAGYLLQSSYQNISVLDISNTPLQQARERLGKDANRIRWIYADILEHEESEAFALWHDRAVFHFLTDPQDQFKYIERMKKQLQDGGYIIIATFAVGGPRKCSGLDTVQYDADKIRQSFGTAFSLIEVVPEIHLTPANIEQKFNYFWFRKKTDPVRIVSKSESV